MEKFVFICTTEEDLKNSNEQDYPCISAIQISAENVSRYNIHDNIMTFDCDICYIEATINAKEYQNYFKLKANRLPKRKGVSYNVNQQPNLFFYTKKIDQQPENFIKKIHKFIKTKINKLNGTTDANTIKNFGYNSARSDEALEITVEISEEFIFHSSKIVKLNY